MKIAVIGSGYVGGRNQYDPAYLRRAGFDYLAVGRDNRRLRAEAPTSSMSRRQSQQ